MELAWRTGTGMTGVMHHAAEDWNWHDRVMDHAAAAAKEAAVVCS
jgi:hypothetical protein